MPNQTHSTTNRTSARAALERAVPGGVYAIQAHAFAATVDIPEAGIEAGDVIAYASSWRVCDLRAVNGRAVRVPRDAFAAVRESAASLVPLSGEPVGDLCRFLRRRTHGGDATSPLVILYPRESAVSHPIAAPSDDAAIFELLAQLGCAMPRAA